MEGKIVVPTKEELLRIWREHSLIEDPSCDGHEMCLSHKTGISKFNIKDSSSGGNYIVDSRDLNGRRHLFHIVDNLFNYGAVSYVESRMKNDTRAEFGYSRFGSGLPSLDYLKLHFPKGNKNSVVPLELVFENGYLPQFK